MKPPIVRSIIAALSIAVIALGINVVHLRRLLEKERLQVHSDLTTANSVRGASVPSWGENTPIDHRTQPEPRATDPVFEEVSGMSQKSRVQPVLRKPGPEEIQHGLAENRAHLSVAYPDVGKVLGLDPGQVNALFDLFIRQVGSIKSGSVSPGEDPAQAYMRMYQANETEIATFLGSKYPLWHQYQDETPIRDQMNDLKIVLAAGNLPPLDQATADAMRTDLNRAQKEISQQLPPALATMSVVDLYTDENIQTFSEIASRYLTPEQLSSYKQLLGRTGGREHAFRATDGAK